MTNTTFTHKGATFTVSAKTEKSAQQAMISSMLFTIAQKLMSVLLEKDVELFDEDGKFTIPTDIAWAWVWVQKFTDYCTTTTVEGDFPIRLPLRSRQMLNTDLFLKFVDLVDDDPELWQKWEEAYVAVNPNANASEDAEKNDIPDGNN